MASGYWVGQCRYRTSLSSQEVLFDSTVLGGRDQICIVAKPAWHMCDQVDAPENVLLAWALPRAAKTNMQNLCESMTLPGYTPLWLHEGQSGSSWPQSRGGIITGGIFPVVSSMYAEASVIPWLLFFFFLKHLYWSIIASQWCVSFCFITKWISYRYTHVPISPPTRISLPPTLPIPPL